MGRNFISAYFFFVIITTAPSLALPDLSHLLSGITCDLFITQIDSTRELNGKRLWSDFSFQSNLPTTVFSVWGRNSYDLFLDASQVRPNPCRIVYVLDYFSVSYGLLGMNYFVLKPYKYWTRAGTRHVNSEQNMFPLVFLNGWQGAWDSSNIWRIEQIGLEFLGVLQIRQDSKLEICLVVNAFKIQFEIGFQTCVGGGGNVLQIFQKSRQPPRQWFTNGIHLGISREHDQSDITALKQNSNAMNRLGKMHSVHLDHIGTVFAKSNSSLIFDIDKNQWKAESRFDLGVLNSRPTFGRDIFILTGLGGYAFLSCYSQRVITFDFYVTPFQPELWGALLVSYISLTLALSVCFFLKKIKTSFCPWLYVLGALIEDGVPIPRKLEKHSIFRVIFGCWIIIGVLFSNCYTGLMITGLNAPLPSTSVNTFKELLCNYQEVKYSYADYGKMNNSSYLHSSETLKFMKFVDSIQKFLFSDIPTENPYRMKSCFSLMHFPKIYDFADFLFDTYLNYMLESFYDNSKPGMPTTHKYELELNFFSKTSTPRNSERTLIILTTFGWRKKSWNAAKLPLPSQ